MPEAARLGDMCEGHSCFQATPIISGSGDVLIDFMQAARKGDEVLMHMCTCPSAPPIQHGMHSRTISEGSKNVLINDKPAARVGDKVNCGGSVSVGSSDVIIGDTPYKSDVQGCVESTIEDNMPFLQIEPFIRFDERVCLKNNLGEPIANMPYFIETETKTYQGTSGLDGLLPRIMTDKEENLQIYLGVPALERWK